jgi:hypothetical protein
VVFGYLEGLDVRVGDDNVRVSASELKLGLWVSEGSTDLNKV